MIEEPPILFTLMASLVGLVLMCALLLIGLYLFAELINIVHYLGWTY